MAQCVRLKKVIYMTCLQRSNEHLLFDRHFKVDRFIDKVHTSGCINSITNEQKIGYIAKKTEKGTRHPNTQQAIHRPHNFK